MKKSPVLQIFLKSKKKLALYIVFNFFATATFVGLSYVMQLLVDVGANDFDFFWYMLAIAVGYIIILSVFAFVNYRLVYSFYLDYERDLRRELYNAIDALNYEEFHSVEVSAYISRILTDASKVSDQFYYQIMMLYDEAWTFIFSAILAFFINWIIALIMIGFGLIVFLLPIIFAKRLNKQNLQHSEAVEGYVNELQKALGAHDLYKAYGVSLKYQKQLDEVNNNRFYKTRAYWWTISDLNSWNILIIVSLQIISLALGVWFAHLDMISSGAVLAVVTVSSTMLNPLNVIASRITNIRASKGIVEILDAILLKKIPEILHPNLFFTDQIELRNVSYIKEEKMILADINLTIKKNKRYLFLGSSGSGKTTLMRVIAKMVTPTSGFISMDDIDYREVQWGQLSEHYAYVNQDFEYANSSIRDNIDIAGTNNETLFEAAISFSCLNREHFNRSFDLMPSDLVDKPLSGGEKQRINIARAIYRDVNPLLFDEVTASLDKKTESIILNNIVSLEAKTLIHIAHKVTRKFAQTFDYTVVLHEGKIIFNGKCDDSVCLDKFLI